MRHVTTVEIVAYCLQCGATRPTREMLWTGVGWLCAECCDGPQIKPGRSVEQTSNTPQEATGGP